jgi:hypothetical protein
MDGFLLTDIKECFRNYILIDSEIVDDSGYFSDMPVVISHAPFVTSLDWMYSRCGVDQRGWSLECR